MPFTPFHFGAGATLHAASPWRISFLAFCGPNVLIDVEPLYYMLRGKWPIHRFFHTFVGAAFAAVLTIAVGMLLLRASRRIALPNYFHWQQAGFAIELGIFLIVGGVTLLSVKLSRSK
jgi:hypothetical protein